MHSLAFLSLWHVSFFFSSLAKYDNDALYGGENNDIFTRLNEQKLAAQNVEGSHRTAARRQRLRRGSLVVSAALRSFLCSRSHLFEVSLTFLRTSCPLRWDSVPTLFKMSEPSSSRCCSSRPVGFKRFFLSCVYNRIRMLRRDFLFWKRLIHKVTERTNIWPFTAFLFFLKSTRLILPRRLLPNKQQFSQRGPGVRAKPCC